MSQTVNRSHTQSHIKFGQLSSRHTSINLNTQKTAMVSMSNIAIRQKKLTQSLYTFPDSTLKDLNKFRFASARVDKPQAMIREYPSDD